MRYSTLILAILCACPIGSLADCKARAHYGPPETFCLRDDPEYGCQVLCSTLFATCVASLTIATNFWAAALAIPACTPAKIVCDAMCHLPVAN